MAREVVLAREVPTWDRFKADPERGMQALEEAMSQGVSLHEFAREVGISVMTLHRWIHLDEERTLRYVRAQEVRAHYWADEITREAERPVARLPKGGLDPADVALKRLRVDSLKWVASKLAPRHYGDRIEVQAKVTHDVVGELREFIAGGSRLPLRHADGRVVVDKRDVVDAEVREMPSPDRHPFGAV